MVDLSAVYPEVVARSAALHLEALKLAMMAGGMTSSTRRAADSLALSVEAALRRGPALTAEEVPFSAQLLLDIPAEARALLVNQATPGLGRDDAPVLIMGTEHAYDVADADSVGTLAVEGCGMAVLWLCGSRSDVVARIGGASVWADRGPGPFHIYASDYHLVLDRRAGYPGIREFVKSPLARRLVLDFAAIE